MRHLSSIFSFNTLKLKRGVPKATLLALLLVLGAEAAVRYRVAQLDSMFGHSFVFQFHRHESLIHNTEHDVWFIGNSTLSAGLDEARFETQADLSAATMPHGSCSLVGYADLLDYYLQRGPAPDRLIIFVSKDDLNLNGLRAESTEQYLRYTSESPLRPSHWLMMYYDRQELRQAALDQIDTWYSALRGQTPASKQRFQVEGLDRQAYEPGQDLAQVYNLREAVRDWELDRQSVRKIVASAKRHGVSQTCFVFLPCTDELALLHDQMVPGMPYETLRDSFRALCAEAGASCLDIAVPSQRYDLFYDAFHMNVWGQSVTTQIVSQWVRDGSPNRPAMSRAEFDDWVELVREGDPDEWPLTPDARVDAR